MAGTFNLRIATPEKEVFNGQVESVSLPGMDGRFGVLRNHAPLVAALEAGLVDVYDASGQETRISIGGGFFEVLSNEAILLADSAEFSQDIDVERARESEKRARARLAGQVEPEHLVQRDRAETALKRAQNRLRVASGR